MTTKREAMRQTHQENTLLSLGFTRDEAERLRRISMQLRRWHELECGIDSGGVERDETTGECSWYNCNTGRRSPFPDRETGALKRLAAITAPKTPLRFYVQSDPRGCALYILRPDDAPQGQEDAYYSRGIAVY